MGECKTFNVDLVVNSWQCADNDIEIWFSYPEQRNKNSIIQHFHRTQRKLLKYTVAKGKPCIDDLQIN